MTKRKLNFESLNMPVILIPWAMLTVLVICMYTLGPYTISSAVEFNSSWKISFRDTCDEIHLFC